MDAVVGPLPSNPDPGAALTEDMRAVVREMRTVKDEILAERSTVVRDAAREMRNEIGRMVRAEDHSRILTAVIAAGFLLLAGIGGGYWAGHRDGARQLMQVEGAIGKKLAVMSPDDAERWAQVIAWNPDDLTRAQNECWSADSGGGNQRRACSFLLWVSGPTTVPAASLPVSSPTPSSKAAK
jgi:hypothetical protein